MNARAAGIVEAVVGVVLGLAFVHSGAAAWLWERVETDVPWHNGPTATGVLAYFAIYWGAWFIIRIAMRVPMARAAEATAHAFIASCIVVAIQVLIGEWWLPVTLATLLASMLLNAYLVRESLRRTIIAWAWTGAGLALATLLIHPYFVASPLFVVRLAIVMAAWDWLGERLGVTPRLLRFVPSLYSGSSSRVAAQARVTR